MIKKIIRSICAIAILANFSWSVKAQLPEELLGLPYNSPEITKMVLDFSSSKPLESFIPSEQLYRQNYLQDGVSLDYNSDISLYRILLYDSGFSYKQFLQPLPKGVKWGMSKEQVEKKTGLLVFEDTNPFVGILTTEDFTTRFYFENGSLNHINCTATERRLKDKLGDVIKGTGMRLLPNGKATSGNVTDGEGTMRWGDGAAVYQGEWAFGLPHGKGKYIDSVGNKYEGEFKLGFPWGQGMFKSDKFKYTYIGTMVMGKRHFDGKIIYGTNSGAYEGDWVQDNMQGIGKYYMGLDYFYEGGMINNTITGKGTLQTPDGTITGTFKNGKPDGLCTQKSKDGLRWARGNFDQGKKNGLFTISSNGMQSQIEFEDDIEIKTGSK